MLRQQAAVQVAGRHALLVVHTVLHVVRPRHARCCSRAAALQRRRGGAQGGSRGRAVQLIPTAAARLLQAARRRRQLHRIRRPVCCPTVAVAIKQGLVTRCALGPAPRGPHLSLLRVPAALHKAEQAPAHAAAAADAARRLGRPALRHAARVQGAAARGRPHHRNLRRRAPRDLDSLLFAQLTQQPAGRGGAGRDGGLRTREAAATQGWT